MKALEDIETAFKIIKTEKILQEINPADKNYQDLQCDIEPIPTGDKMDKVSILIHSRNLEIPHCFFVRSSKITCA